MSAPSDGFCLREIGRERNEDMLRILEESPVVTRDLTVGFERRPDVFALSELFSEQVACVGFVRGEELYGFAMPAFRKLYVNGEPRRVMYFGNVHVKREARGRDFVCRVSDYLAKKGGDRPDLGYALVMSGNRAAETFIGRRKPGFPDLPYSRVVGTFCAWNIPVTLPKKESWEYRVRRAGAADVNAIVALLEAELRPRLFAPVIDRRTFLEDISRRPGCALSDYYVAERWGKIVGTCAAWDMGRLKQIRIFRYGQKLEFARRLYAVLARLAGSAPMPRRGGILRTVTVTDCAVRGRDPAVLEALLRKIYRDVRERRYHMLIVGGCRRDPLLAATEKFIARSVVSHIVLFANNPALLADGRIDATLPYVDPAML
jgi:hypothetical protein